MEKQIPLIFVLSIGIREGMFTADIHWEPIELSLWSFGKSSESVQT